MFRNMIATSSLTYFFQLISWQTSHTFFFSLLYIMEILKTDTGAFSSIKKWHIQPYSVQVLCKLISRQCKFFASLLADMYNNWLMINKKVSFFTYYNVQTQNAFIVIFMFRKRKWQNTPPTSSSNGMQGPPLLFLGFNRSNNVSKKAFPPSLKN